MKILISLFFILSAIQSHAYSITRDQCVLRVKSSVGPSYFASHQNLIAELCVCVADKSKRYPNETLNEATSAILTRYYSCEGERDRQKKVEAEETRSNFEEKN